ncbi:MAG: hypothetical protein EHM71_14675, partial [Zetaproteobacteria bacterium]
MGAAPPGRGVMGGRTHQEIKSIDLLGNVPYFTSPILFHNVPYFKPAEDDTPPCRSQPRRKVVADKGYHAGALLRQLKTQRYRTYIPERRQTGRRRWT